MVTIGRQERWSIKYLYGGKSRIHGQGLFTRKSLSDGEDIGHLSTITSCYTFHDNGIGGLINHSLYPNIDLYHKFVDNTIQVWGRANQKIRANSELTADYSHLYAPKPNFVADPDAKYCQYVTFNLSSNISN